jgi:hypothetical protein
MVVGGPGSVPRRQRNSALITITSLLLLPICHASSATEAVAVGVSVIEAKVVLQGFASPAYWTLDHRAVFWKAASNYLNVSGVIVEIEDPCVGGGEHRRRLGTSYSTADHESDHGINVDLIVTHSSEHSLLVHTELTKLRDASEHHAEEHRMLGSNPLQLLVDEWKGVYAGMGLVSAPTNLSLSVAEVHVIEGERCATEHHAHPSLFELRMHFEHFPLDPREILGCFVALVTITIIFEELVHRTDNLLEFKAPHFNTIFESICKELMILGFISFTIFICEQAAALNKESFYLEMELVHIIIFFVAMILALKAMWLLVIMDSARKFWDQVI